LLGVSQGVPNRDSPKVINRWIDAIAAGADGISKARLQVEGGELAAIGAGLIASVTMEPQSSGRRLGRRYHSLAREPIAIVPVPKRADAARGRR
jgi:hypothetical protein